MSPLLIAALSFSLSQLLLSLLLLLREPAWGVRERLYGLLMLALLGYVATPVVAGSWMGLPASVVQTAAPGLFWLFSYSLFDDGFRLRAWQLGLVGFTVFMPLLGRLVASADWLFFTLPQAVEFALLGAALWVVARNWRSDLVEARRRLRLWFVALTGSYSLLLLFSREILFPGAAWLATWEYLALALLLLGINVSLLRYHRGLLFQQLPEVLAPDVPVTPEVSARASIEPEAVAKLEAFMREHAIWREMGLTLGQLAEKLETPQYRVRQVINQGLGYRNFNDFLNSYRVKEAAERLASPEQASLPVLTIAMDAGFRSLSAFNKAFKDAQGMTPTAWRRAHVPEKAAEAPKN
ncbi:MAG: AraC family transcriptional regulator [Halieaceae bacterium]|jgi:AraC-like DNA-binding protein|nr:AraC family transcriptional regulator [Halieaceae bacterium]